MAVLSMDHSFKEWGNAYNFFGILREHSNIPEKEILELSGKFKAGDTDAMLVNLDGKNYYLVYEKSEIQDWVFLGLVKADIVNASMNVLQLQYHDACRHSSVECCWSFYLADTKEKQGKPQEKRYGDPVQGRAVSEAFHECG